MNKYDVSQVIQEFNNMMVELNKDECLVYGPIEGYCIIKVNDMDENDQDRYHNSTHVLIIAHNIYDLEKGDTGRGYTGNIIPIQVDENNICTCTSEDIDEALGDGPIYQGGRKSEIIEWLQQFITFHGEYKWIG